MSLHPQWHELSKLTPSKEKNDERRIQGHLSCGHLFNTEQIGDYMRLQKTESLTLVVLSMFISGLKSFGF